MNFPASGPSSSQLILGKLSWIALPFLRILVLGRCMIFYVYVVKREYFSLRLRTRQGYLLPSFLLIIVLEILISAIR
jgi:hypothetical protein